MFDNSNPQCVLSMFSVLERFSFEWLKNDWFCITTLPRYTIGLKKTRVTFSYNQKWLTKTDGDALALVFPRFASATWIYYEPL